MENTTLRDIIEVEKEIQQNVDRTKDSLRDWLAGQKKEVQDRLAQQEAELAAGHERAREELVRDARVRAADTVKGVQERSERLARLKNEVLTAIIERNMHRILPG